MLIAKRIHGLRSLQVALDALVSLALFWLLLLSLAQLRGWFDLDWSRYGVYSALVVLGLLIDFFWAARWEPQQNERQYQGRVAWHMGLQQTFVVFVMLVSFLVAFKDLAISRFFLVLYLPLQFIALGFLNYYLPSWLGRNLFRAGRTQKTLVIGGIAAVHRIQHWIRKNEQLGFAPIGFLLSESDISPSAIQSMECLGRLNDLAAVLKSHRVSLVLCTTPSRPDELKAMHDVCDAYGARLVVCYDFGSHLGRSVSFFSERGMQFLSFREEPLESPANRILKRGLDVIISLMVIIWVLPVASLLVWILQRRQSPGPLLFRQTRSGLHNQEFIIYKYRTMHHGVADSHVQATQRDARVFPAARWMRRLSIDELPQFINVLLGEMSIVGPRPHMLVHDQSFSETDGRYRVRQLVKPGITGLAQVRGLRGETREGADVVARTSADLQYLENWSLGLDISIIARTVIHMLRAPRSAC